MEAITKRLPLLAFVLAAFAAVAFTGPQDHQPEYGLDESTWINVTALTPGVDYDCNLEEEEVCTRSAPNPSAPMVKPGIFVFPAN